MGTASVARTAWTIVAHGGAGAIGRGDLSPAQDRAYRAGMMDALEAGAADLRGGASALDAVESAVRRLEDNPLFNAGRGSVFTAEGRNELDASLMDGATLRAGAVAGLTRTRNPISAARQVMEDSPHVMLVGEGAEAFARSRGLAAAEPAWFYTETRWRTLEAVLRAQGRPVPPRPPGAGDDGGALLAHDEGKHGTVGAVALDVHGRLATATSTGGITAKRWGRVGDSPVIGAGTYASRRCAVSCTGTGEHFIRLGLARTVCALVEIGGLGVQAALDRLVGRDLTTLGGEGGAIALAADGQAAWSFNTAGMYRARMAEGRAPVVHVYKDEP